MSTTTIKFTMKDLDGTVVPYTQFQVASGRLNTGEVPDVMPATTSFTTDVNGQASVVLTVTEAPYYLSKLDGSTDKVVAYKFFVPASDVTLEAELLYVDLGRTSKFYNDKSVAALIEAKVTAVNAANRALQVVTTLGSLDTLRTNLGSIISVGTDIAAVNTVATNIASVNAVNAASTTISAVNAALTNINAVGSSIASVNTVASNIGNVSTVVGMSANIASVVANATDIDTVANNMADVQAAADALPGLTAATTIAPYIAQITDVASNITTVSAVGNNIENINDVAGMEADIEALADNLANLALAAAAVTQAVDAQKQLFTVGVDYSYGISTALALTYVPAKANAVKVFFDGEYQTKDSFNVVHHTITFNSPITASKVEVQYDVPSSFVGLTPSDLVTLQTAETNASNSASASAVSAAASLTSEIDAQQSASAAAVSASSMQQAVDGTKEIFVAGIDYIINSSTTITLDAVPAKSNSLLIFFNGVYQQSSTWTRLGKVVTFNNPIAVASVEAWYQVPSLIVGLTPTDQAVFDTVLLTAANSATAAALSETAAEVAAATVSAAVDGVKDLYVAGTHYTKNVSTSVTLSAAPNKPNTVKVFFNGVYQNKDTYYLVGSTINFGVVGTPAVIDADSVEVQYEIPSQFVGLSPAEQAVLTDAVSVSTASANAAALDAADAEAAKAAAEAARDSVFADAKGAATIADARALVADTETFIVYEAGAATFSAYRRTSSTTEVFLGEYPSFRAVVDAYFGGVLASNGAVINYPFPSKIEKTSTNMILSSGAFSDGTDGLVCTVAGTTLIYADSGITIPASRSDDVVVELVFELTADTDTGTTYGFGLATGESGTRNGVYLFENGGVYKDGDLGTSAQLVDLPSFTVGSVCSVFLLAKAGGGIYGAAVNPATGDLSKWLELTGFAESGRVWISTRRNMQCVFRVRTHDAAQISSNEDARLAFFGNTKMLQPIGLGDPTLAAVSTSVGTPATVLTAGIGYSTDVRQFVFSGTGLGTSGASSAAVGPALTSDKKLSLVGQLKTITSGTPSFGLGFGLSTGAAKGIVFRTSGQALTLVLPSGATAGQTPTTPSYPVGTKIKIDAELLSGSAGNYTVRFYASLSNSAGIFGPYDVSGIESLDASCVMVRGASVYENCVLYESAADGVSGLSNIVYVSGSGSDANTGSKVLPFATFAKAVANVASGGIIEVAGGEYRQALALEPIAGDVTVRAEANERVTILGSNQLTLTKTGGYAQIYQSALTNKPTGMGDGRGPPMIFEWGTPSKPIPAGERHDLQRGETYRLPYTEMLEAATLADLDTVGGRGKWFWSGGVIYLAATDGSDASLKRYEVRARACVTAENMGTVKLQRVDAFFSFGNGMVFRNSIAVHREDCRSFGNYRNGFSDDCGIVHSVRDEAAGNGNDGFNGTPQSFAGTPNRDVMASGIYHDAYGHDNYDDGISYHDRGEATAYGGLFEYNGKDGVTHIAGASCVAYNTISRRNFSKGFGTGTVTTDGRTNSTLRLHGCFAENNVNNYFAKDTGVMLAFDCVSGESTGAGYAQEGGATLMARNCRHGGASAAKSGTVTVVNDAQLT